MDKKPLIVVSLCAVVLLVLGSLSNVVGYQTFQSSVSRDNWLYVGGSGPGNYTRIQDAINDVSDGDTVFVFSGNYYEHIIVSNSINLIGENQESTVIDGNHTGNVMKIFANRVTLTGFTIQNSGDFMYNDVGLDIYSNNNTIIDCVVRNNVHGLGLSYAHGNLISENYVHHNRDGILIGGFSSWNQITNNTIINNDCDGIYIGGNDIISYNHHETIADNVVTRNSFGIDTAGLTDSLITRNTVSDNNYNGMDLDDTVNCVISWNLIRDHGKWGILSEFSSNNTFQHNTLINAGYGLAYYTNHGTPDTWYQNYWGRSRILPKLIFGNRMFNEDDDDHAFCLPWVIIDWHPVQEPYNIGGI
ncbi:MAG: right-handed parallel beta-helix repeat-containing protein [Candidatus Thermoplasmatota archaeon]|nr:right-handed parallel beta-helix repeat-containing protein [Candidatus Thermoplasmatota archaeon]